MSYSLHISIFHIVLFLLQLCFIPLQANTYYAAYFTTTRSDLTFLGTSLRTLMKTDDSPFVPVTLPWPVTIFEKIVSTLFVSPNGALHLEKTQPCANDNNFGTDNCSLENSYQNLIAGYLTDLDPSETPKAQISYYTYKDMFTVAYRNIPYYGTDIYTNFRISLFQDNHIELAYDAITPTNINVRSLLVGLRPPFNSSVLTYDQASLLQSMKIWNTSHPGVYPTVKKNITTAVKYVLCPISTNWCMKHTYIVYNPTQLNSSIATITNTTLSFTTEWLSCTSNIQYAIAYSFNATLSKKDWYDPSHPDAMYVLTTKNILSDCILDKNIPYNFSLTCKIDTFFRNNTYLQESHKQNETMYIWLIWRSTDKAARMTNYVYIPLSTPLALVIIANNSVSNSNQDRNQYASSVWCGNTKSRLDSCPNPVSSNTYEVRYVKPYHAMNTYNTLRSTTCALCEQNYTCFDTVCPYNNTSNTSQGRRNFVMSIYNQQPLNLSICSSTTTSRSSGTTSSTNTSTSQCISFDTPINTWATNLYVQDPHDACCYSNELDCAGYCHGNNTIGKNSAGSVYCCPSRFKVDCAGECNGSAIMDVCGVCNGKDMSGITCFNTSLVQFQNMHTNTNNEHELSSNVTQYLALSNQHTISHSFFPVFNMTNATISTSATTGLLQVTLATNHQILQIVNHHTSPIVLNISLLNESYAQQTISPFLDILLLSRTHIIVMNESSIQIPLTFSITSLLTALMNGNMTIAKQIPWGMKSLLFQYYREPYPEAVFTSSMNIFTTMIHCEIMQGWMKEHFLDTIRQQRMCMNLPGCRYCLYYEKMYYMKGKHPLRTYDDPSLTASSSNTLRSTLSSAAATTSVMIESDTAATTSVMIESDSTLSITQEQEEEVEDISRRVLFSSMIPRQDSNHHDTMFDGVCMTGWEESSCDIEYDEKVHHVYTTTTTNNAGSIASVMMNWSLYCMTVMIIILHLSIAG